MAHTMLGRAVLFVGLGLLSLTSVRTEAQSGDRSADLAFLEPWFRPSGNERQTLATRGAVVRSLPADGKQIGIIAVTAIDISVDAFVSRMRTALNVAGGERAAGRLGDPPAIADLMRLSLDEGDIDRLRGCRPGDCRLNLSDREIDGVRSAFTKSSGGDFGEVQRTFRAVIVDRARRYLSGGLAALPDYHDRSDPVPPARIFAEILAQSPYVTTRLPGVATYLERYPSTDIRPSDSFLYWSKVIMNDKAVVRASHVSVFRGDADVRLPRVAVVGKQIYASRYMNGELTMTLLFAGGSRSSNYLVHVDRSELDELGGAFSGLKRRLIEGRIKSEATGELARLRDRLERPPDGGG